MVQPVVILRPPYQLCPLVCLHCNMLQGAIRCYKMLQDATSPTNERFCASCVQDLKYARKAVATLQPRLKRCWDCWLQDVFAQQTLHWSPAEGVEEVQHLLGSLWANMPVPMLQQRSCVLFTAAIHSFLQEMFEDGDSSKPIDHNVSSWYHHD